MRHGFLYATLALAVIATPNSAAAQGDASRTIAGGGVFVPGWTGAVDASAARSGQSLTSAKLTREGNGLHAITGPATTWWNPANVAKGDYTVSATFTEPKFMNLNDHAHPYGIMIAGNDLGTDHESLLYCAAYGTGMFIVRGFGPAPFQLNGREGAANAAVHKAAAPGQPVTQVVAMQVKGDNVSCIINGTVVATYPKSQLVAAGKLKSTDGVYGIRFAHNTEGIVTDLKVTHP